MLSIQHFMKLEYKKLDISLKNETDMKVLKGLERALKIFCI